MQYWRHVNVIGPAGCWTTARQGIPRNSSGNHGPGSPRGTVGSARSGHAISGDPRVRQRAIHRPGGSRIGPFHRNIPLAPVREQQQEMGLALSPGPAHDAKQLPLENVGLAGDAPICFQQVLPQAHVVGIESEKYKHTWVAVQGTSSDRKLPPFSKSILILTTIR